MRTTIIDYTERVKAWREEWQRQDAERRRLLELFRAMRQERGSPIRPIADKPKAD